MVIWDLFDVIRDLKRRIFDSFYLENDEHFEKYYWTKVVQNDPQSIMHYSFNMTSSEIFKGHVRGLATKMLIFFIAKIAVYRSLIKYLI